MSVEPDAARGLTAEQARERLRTEGPNALPELPPLPLWRRIGRQLASPLVYILIFALVFDLGSWVYHDDGSWPLEAIVIFAVLLLNAGLGVIQELRSEKALARLKLLAAPRAWVIRDGHLEQVAAIDIVPGDRVRLEAGDRVPADGQLDDAHGVSIDESLMTGESVPVDKQDGDGALSGTLLVRGRGFLEVTRTGAASSMGRLASALGAIEAVQTPLERRLQQFGARIARWVLAVAAMMLVAGVAIDGISRIGHVLLFAVALAVAAVPEGLPAVVTLTLALGVLRMARRHAVVRRLAAVEALGSVTVIATDKTGTLTENRMQVALLVAGADVDQALAAMVLASDADPGSPAAEPLERALVDHAVEHGVDIDDLRKRFPRQSERPFDSAWRFMRATVAGPDGPRSYLKGAPESILARARLSDADRTRWGERAAAEARHGHRVIALARGEGDTEQDLELLGLVMLWDPPRPEAAQAIRTARAAGIRILMITGDHGDTAAAIAAHVGLDTRGGTLTGAELERMTPAQLREAVARTGVFARVDPTHKLAIVEALQAAGEVVAVTGDGVNDAPALRRSDVGVAMGRRGSEVAREASDLVLVDDNFATIVAAVEEGRGIYANIQKSIRFLLSTNAAEMLIVLGGAVGAALMGLREASGELLVPLTAAQLLWINMITDGPPALALGVDRNAGLMDRPPHPQSTPLLDRASLRFVALTGAFKALLAGILLLALPAAGSGVDEARSALFLYASLGQLVFAYPARMLPHTSAPWILHLAVAGGAAVQLLAFTITPLRVALDLVPLHTTELLAVAAAVALSWGVAEGASRWFAASGRGIVTRPRGRVHATS